MSFFFDTIEVPFWFIVFIFASASPLWIKWSKKFHKKFIVTGLLAKRFNKAKSAAEMKMDIFNKISNNSNDNSELSGFSDSAIVKRKMPKKEIDPVIKENIQTVLKVLAEAGEIGVLPQSISDKTNVSTLDTTHSLKYLADKKYAEEINSTNGTKYYLTDLGRRYCLSKKII